MLEEEELSSLFKTLLSKEGFPDRYLKCVTGEIQRVVRSRHFSEEFILEFLEYLSADDVLAAHSFEIMSGKYSSVRLYLDAKNELK
jgi:hypothetical protein